MTAVGRAAGDAGSPLASSANADELKYAHVFTPWLEPGERVCAAVSASLNGRIRSRVPRRYRPPKSKEESSGSCLGRILVGVLFVLSWVFDDGAQYVGEALGVACMAVVRAIIRPVRGRPFRGGWRSQAGHFVIAVRRGPSFEQDYTNGRVMIAVTERRILLCYDGIRTEILGSVPRGELRKAVDRQTWFSSRVDLHFADASLVAVQVQEAGRMNFLSWVNG